MIEHHTAHLSSAFHVSPFDDAVIVSVDGFEILRVPHGALEKEQILI